ncbi:MAG: hypothetical protein KF725_07085 [Cyclobacteriaceae bacterium]|nr:hypothetical protein [Cyclobacteriaceae bacterium]UYN88311.1 MAG: hypothetical protein KIT51_08720 [Cyclobacteriaceae bacterium]
MNFNRKAYQSLLEWKKRSSRKPLLLRGARQVGMQANASSIIPKPSTSSPVKPLASPPPSIAPLHR